MNSTDESKVMCVAGGTSGIGKAVALACLEEDVNVCVIGRSTEHADEFREEAKAYVGQFDVLIGDLTSPMFVHDIVEEIRGRHGRLDTLVNSAGTIGAGGIEVESKEEWDRVIAANLSATYLLTKACLPLLKEGKNASIVNVSSVCSHRPCTSVSYSVSKAGIDMFTKVLAKELGKYGIRVNSVNPSVVRSNLQMSAGLFSSSEEYEEWVKKMEPTHPLGRIGLPEDVANAILYLASDKATWVTGATLCVDGGRGIV